MKDDKKDFLVFSGTATRYLAEKICASLGCPLGNLVITEHSFFFTHSFILLVCFYKKKKERKTDSFKPLFLSFIYIF